jgi:hypothetical protein
MSTVASVADRPPKQPAKRSTFHELLLRGLEGCDVEGFKMAAEKYGGDAARELSDLRAGRHPLQRRKRAR